MHLDVGRAELRLRLITRGSTKLYESVFLIYLNVHESYKLCHEGK